jgi:hypothetical protein
VTLLKQLNDFLSKNNNTNIPIDRVKKLPRKIAAKWPFPSYSAIGKE